jgi:hypothetical protein
MSRPDQPDTNASDALDGLDPAALLRHGVDPAAATATAPNDAARWQPPTPAELTALLPQFEVIELIGQGGMGAVYRAVQRRLDRTVALKVLPCGGDGDADFTARFVREAQTLARLNHPSLVTVHDFGQTGAWCWLAMEFVDGANLRQVMRTGRLSPEQALAVVPQLCDALQYAHDEGVVHRDIKPENILMDGRGRVKIADFGLAKLRGDQEEEARLTGSGTILGTAHYMAPEQIEGARSVDHRADIYSLGVVFYEMLTGGLPLGRFEPPSRRVDIDVRLDEVVLKALEKDPQRRYQQASEVQAAVDGAQTGRSTGAARTRPAQPETAERRRDRFVGEAGALIVGGLIVGFLALRELHGLNPLSAPLPVGISLLAAPLMIFAGACLQARALPVMAGVGSYAALAPVVWCWQSSWWLGCLGLLAALWLAGSVGGKNWDRHFAEPPPRLRALMLALVAALLLGAGIHIGANRASSSTPAPAVEVTPGSEAVTAWRCSGPGVHALPGSLPLPTARRFAARPQLRWSGVSGTATVRMWVGLDGGASYFSERALADPDTGTSMSADGGGRWREITLPFDATTSTAAIRSITVEIVLPGAGTVETRLPVPIEDAPAGQAGAR